VARVFVILGFALVITGMVVAWPLIFATSHYQMVRGRILEVFTQPLPDQRVRLSVAYDYPIPARHGRVFAIGHAQADQRFQPIPDLVIPASQVPLYERVLLREAPVRRVFLDVNDPVGSAFMITDVSVGRSLSAEQGVALGLLGLLMWCVGYLVRARGPE
jgi:hypothetical protein